MQFFECSACGRKFTDKESNYDESTKTCTCPRCKEKLIISDSGIGEKLDADYDLDRTAETEKWEPDAVDCVNYTGMGIKVINGGDAVEYAYPTDDGYETPTEAEIVYEQNEDGDEEDCDFEPCFYTKDNVRYFLGDFVRTNSPWMK